MTSASGAGASPVVPVEFSILLALADGPSYGYRLVKAIAKSSGGAVRIAPGNLYQVLDRLLSRGWIRELEPEKLPKDADGRRRYYELTKTGVGVTRAEAARLRALMPTIEQLEPRLLGGAT